MAQTIFFEEKSTGGNFTSLNFLARYGNHIPHQQFLDELEKQNENRMDISFDASTARFVGNRFVVGDNNFPIDEIALLTLAERLKVNGSHTVTRNGLKFMLDNNPALFAETGNYFLRQANKPILFRSLYDWGIAFASNQYTVVNHHDLMSRVLNTLSNVFGENAQTTHNFLNKSLLYSFIPLPDSTVTIRNINNQEDNLTMGIEVRNSEVLQNAIVVSFKIVRMICSNGLILGENTGTLYQRHIGLTTEDALDNVQKGILEMFQEEGIQEAMNSLEVLSTLMETPVSNGEEYAKKFAELIGFNDKQTRDLIEAGRIENDSTVYGWSLGPLTYLAHVREGNRSKQEEWERLGGSFLTNPKRRDSLLELV